jgi:hypothetical protein
MKWGWGNMGVLPNVTQFRLLCFIFPWVISVCVLYFCGRHLSHRNPTSRSRIHSGIVGKRKVRKAVSFCSTPLPACILRAGWQDISWNNDQFLSNLVHINQSGHPVCGCQLLRYPIPGVTSAETFCRKKTVFDFYVDVGFLWSVRRWCTTWASTRSTTSTPTPTTWPQDMWTRNPFYETPFRPETFVKFWRYFPPKKQQI